MSFLILRSVFTLLLATALAGFVLAQDDPAPSSGKISSPISVADLDNAERAVVESLRRIERTVREEIDADRLKKTDATGDSMHAQFLLGLAERGNASAVEFHSRSGGRNRSGNAKIGAAWEAFDQAREARHVLIRDQLPTFISDRLQDAAITWRTARQPSDLTPAITVLRGVQDHIEPLSDAREDNDVKRVEEALKYLEAFKELLLAEESEDAVLIANAVRKLKGSSSPLGDFLSLKEIEERRKSVIAKLRDQGEVAFRQCLAALPTAKRPEDLGPVMAQLHEAADAEEALTQRQDGEWVGRFERAERVASHWQRILATEEGGYWQDAGTMAKELMPAARELLPSLATVLSRRAAEDERRGRDDDRGDVRALAAKLERIANTADARALVLEVRSMLREEKFPAEDARELASVAGDLEQLSQITVSPDGARSFTTFALGFSRDHPWTAQVAGAAERVRMRSLARWCGRPELLAEPMKNRPVEEALDQLATAAAKREDWRDAYDLLTLRAVVAPNLPPLSETPAIRSFLAAQNFERAEIFDMAISLYAKVLRSTGPHVPSAKAAERLKQLTREHPEAPKPPSQ